MRKELHPTTIFLNDSIDKKILFLKDKSNSTKDSITRTIALIMLGRPRTCIPGYLTFMLGACYNEVPFSWKFVLAAILSFLIGFSSNLHNTYTDIEEDVNNLPGRIFVLAKYGYSNLFRTLILLDSVMLLSSFFLGTYFIVFMVLAILGLQQYSFPPYRAKNKPWIGLWVFSQAVVFPFIFGWVIKPEPLNVTAIPAIFFGARSWEWKNLIPSVLTHSNDPLVLAAQKYLWMYCFLTLWFMAKGLYKNIPDYAGDKEAGVKSSATVFSSQKSAAVFASAVTVVVYLLLPILIWQGSLSLRTGFAMIWIIPVMLSCRNLIRANTRKEGNLCLKMDMVISIGFIATVLLLEFPTLASFIYVLVGIIILIVSDVLNMDSRRAKDVSA
jgi:4-hydroxybenzoate polyprenyltransferase